MSEGKKDVLGQVADEAAGVKAQFEKMEADRQAFLKNIADLNREQQVMAEDEVRLQGEYKALMRILGKDPDGKPLPEAGGNETTN